MTRTIVVTGSASGIGQATLNLLTERGIRVLGVDRAQADITTDLSTPEGRARMCTQVAELSGGHVDAIIANAGLAVPTPATVAVNYFGTIATLDGLRPLLAGSPAPRAVATASMASLMPVDDELVGLLRSGDEPGALARAAVLAEDPATTGGLIYSSTKKALCLWIRSHAADAEWAGAGIALNAVAPGVILTPMVADYINLPDGTRLTELPGVPMPLNGFAEPIVVARLLAWLTSEENTHLCGQVVFVDGGSDAVIRGDSTW